MSGAQNLPLSRFDDLGHEVFDDGDQLPSNRQGRRRIRDQLFESSHGRRRQARELRGFLLHFEEIRVRNLLSDRSLSHSQVREK